MSDRLRQTSLQLLEAMAARDLDAAGQALQEREAAIAVGEIPTEEVIELGEHAIALLEDFKRRAGFDAARLKQLHHTLTPDAARPQVDLHL